MRKEGDDFGVMIQNYSSRVERKESELRKVNQQRKALQSKVDDLVKRTKQLDTELAELKK